MAINDEDRQAKLRELGIQESEAVNHLLDLVTNEYRDQMPLKVLEAANRLGFTRALIVAVTTGAV
jgi:hypothetical protein